MIACRRKLSNHREAHARRSNRNLLLRLPLHSHAHVIHGVASGDVAVVNVHSAANASGARGERGTAFDIK